MWRHTFDSDSVTNPVTGKPYGPGPLWAGTEPMDYPDPYCECGAYWTEGVGCGETNPVRKVAYAVWPPLVELPFLLSQLAGSVSSRWRRSG